MTTKHMYRTALGGLMTILAITSEISHAQELTPMTPHVPNVVVNGQAAAIGQLDQNRYLHLVLTLPLRDEAGLDNFIEQLYDRRSPNYHRYLMPDEFASRFGPTQKDYDAVVHWAQSQGLSVTRTVPQRSLVDVAGSVSTINRAFRITMTSYRHPIGNRIFFAPDREPVLNLAVPLLAISGLTDVNPPHSHLRMGTATIDSTGVKQAASPVARITGSGPANNYLPSDMRAAYYGSGPLTGKGQTVAVFSFNGYLDSDLQLSGVGRGDCPPDCPWVIPS